MMDQLVRIQRCPNCGSTFRPEEFMVSRQREETSACICLVCDFHVTDQAPVPPDAVLTVDELQVRLISLFTSARTRGVSPQEIVRILRNELAFEAELDAPGRRMLVQIIDLGQLEPVIQSRSSSRAPEILHSRSLGQ